MKTKTFLLSLLLLLPLLASCTFTARYATDRSVTELCEAALQALDEDDLVLDTVGITDDYFSMPDTVTEHVIVYCKDTDCIDEFGIFRVEAGNTEAVAALLRKQYLAPAYEKNRDFYNSYIPDETVKLAEARVECYGNVVVYAILSPADQSTLFSAIRKALQ